MIRFVDLRNQLTGYDFAFWNTCTDMFVDIGHEQAWDSKEDFINAALECEDFDLPRFLRLIPDWVHTCIPTSDDTEESK